MKRLEKKILKGVYSFETRQTLSQLILRLLAIMSFTLGGFMLAGVIVKVLIQQQTLDVFEIFFEDIDTIRENIWEVVGTFLQEAPKFEILIAILTVILAVVLVFKFILNFVKIKNKLSSLVKFWLAR